MENSSSSDLLGLVALIVLVVLLYGGIRLFARQTIISRFFSLVMLTPSLPFLFFLVITLVSSCNWLTTLSVGHNSYLSVYDPDGVDIFFFAAASTKSSSDLGAVLLQGVYLGLVPAIVFLLIIIGILFAGGMASTSQHRAKVGEIEDNYGNRAEIYETWTEHHPEAIDESFETARGCMGNFWIVLLMFLFGMAFSFTRYYYDFVNSVRIINPPESWFGEMNRASDVVFLFFVVAIIILWVYGWLELIVSRVRMRL